MLPFTQIENAKTHYEKALDDLHRDYQKAFQHQNDAWERRFAQVETELGVQLDRPSNDAFNRCSMITMPAMQNASFVASNPDDGVEQDSFLDDQQPSIEISDESGSESSSDDCSIHVDMFDEQPPEKRINN